MRSVSESDAVGVPVSDAACRVAELVGGRVVSTRTWEEPTAVALPWRCGWCWGTRGWRRRGAREWVCIACHPPVVPAGVEIELGPEAAQ